MDIDVAPARGHANLGNWGYQQLNRNNIQLLWTIQYSSSINDSRSKHFQKCQQYQICKTSEGSTKLNNVKIERGGSRGGDSWVSMNSLPRPGAGSMAQWGRLHVLHTGVLRAESPPLWAQMDKCKEHMKHIITTISVFPTLMFWRGAAYFGVFFVVVGSVTSHFVLSDL